jgi:hypothetical protein
MLCQASGGAEAIHYGSEYSSPAKPQLLPILLKLINFLPKTILGRLRPANHRPNVSNYNYRLPFVKRHFRMLGADFAMAAARPPRACLQPPINFPGSSS